MNIITEKSVHFWVKNYDINRAGPTLLKHLTNIDLTQIEDKQERNIQYGKFLRDQSNLKIIPSALRAFISRLARESGAVAYTPDSVITKTNIMELSLVKRSIYSFKVEWSATHLVVSKDKKSYIALLANGDVLIKGQASKDISPKLVEHIFKLFEVNLLNFKSSFLRLPASVFAVNDIVVVGDESYKVNDFKTFDLKVNYEYYWRKCLQFIYPIEMYKNNVNMI
jgi:hypothetical protein